MYGMSQKITYMNASIICYSTFFVHTIDYSRNMFVCISKNKPHTFVGIQLMPFSVGGNDLLKVNFIQVVNEGEKYWNRSRNNIIPLCHKENYICIKVEYRLTNFKQRLSY